MELEQFKSRLLLYKQREQVLEFEENATEGDYWKPIYINGYPVFQFAYAGSFPLNDTQDEKINDLMKSYIEWCTYRIYNPDDDRLPLNRVRVIIQHFFDNERITDLDNYNHKFIMDALRMSNIFKDDSWLQVALDISGHKDDYSHIQVYVVEEENRLDFLQYLEKNKHELKMKALPHEAFMKKHDKKVKKNRDNKKNYIVKKEEEKEFFN